MFIKYIKIHIIITYIKIKFGLNFERNKIGQF